MTAAERFWSKVNKQQDANRCWEWMGSWSNKGYGVIGVDGKNRYAHRFSWELHYGAIPDGMMICHHCDNPKCVRPAHLFVGTASDNAQDSRQKGRSRWQKQRDNQVGVSSVLPPEKNKEETTNPVWARKDRLNLICPGEPELGLPCGAEFSTYAGTAEYCPRCRNRRYQRRWKGRRKEVAGAQAEGAD